MIGVLCRLLLAAYDAETGVQLGQQLTSGIVTMANNDATDGPFQKNLTIQLSADWGGWNNGTCPIRSV